jgi:prepilin-type N-terminal cleavage/methylation domain-containing protein
MKSNGFTLIELMIVIAIIGILLAVIVPAFSTTQNADGSICRYDMKYDRATGRQVIGPNGGGIPCDAPINNLGGVR